MSEPAAKQRPMIDLDEFERRLRRPAAAPHPQDDPLAELARLVGGHEDPFKSVFDHDRQSQRAPGAARPAPNMPPRPAPVQPHFVEDKTPLHGTIHPQSYSDERVAPAVYGAVPGQAPRQENAPLPEDDYAFVDAPVAAAREPAFDVPRSRRPLYVMAGIIAIGIAGIGVSFAYKSKSGPHEMPTIMAMSGPTKVQPESPGGIDVPNQDASILDKSPQPAPTGLTSHQEEPVDLARQPMAPPTRTILADAGGTGAASVPVPPPPGGGQQTIAQSYGIDGLPPPRRVKTVPISVSADGTILPNDRPPQIPSSVSASAPQRPAASVATTATPKSSSSKSTARVTTPKPPQSMEQLAADSDAPVVPPSASMSAKPKAAAAKPIKVAEAETGDAAQGATEKRASSGAFAVQFAAPDSEQDAHEQTSKLGSKFGSELSGHRLTYHRVKVKDKTVYRIRTGGLSQEEAKNICEKVKTGGGSCFVTRD